jgi:esterase/lipase superfamily enzyme
MAKEANRREDTWSLQAWYGNQALILKHWGRLEEAMALLKKQKAICLKLGNQDSLQKSYGSQALILEALLLRPIGSSFDNLDETNPAGTSPPASPGSSEASGTSSRPETDDSNGGVGGENGESKVEGYSDLDTLLLEEAGQRARFREPGTMEPSVEQVSADTLSASSPDGTLIQVFYATDRMQVPHLTGDVKYGKQRSLNGNLDYGRCEVSVPKIHRIGKLETPSILRLEFRPNPKRHIVLAKTYGLGEHQFFELVKSSVAKSASKDSFVFMHGYNVSFEDAARRTGQIAYDLDFVGAPIFYSWPSNGKTADYVKDETNMTWSTPHFQSFLALLAQKSGAQRIHIIAHSMGNRGVCDALKALSYDPTSQLKFNHLVLAAPDIDADTFQELAATLQRLAGRITLYESSQDKAIQASKKIHGNPRAGEPLLVVRGMDTIDASAIDTDFLGHSYFSDNWPLLFDIHSILFKDEPPSGRFGLVEIEHEDGKYYAFKR